MEAAFFDLDKTVIARASVAAFRRPFYKEGLISRRTIVHIVYAQLIYLYLGAGEQRLQRIRESMLTLTRGWSQSQISQIVRETLEEIIEPIIFAEALALISEHQAAGRKVFIVSSSPIEIVEPLTEYLGADGAIASRAVVGADDRYTGEMDFYAFGPFKADAIVEQAARDGIDLAASYAYSDSYTDLPMLEVVGHPVAVNPDRVLSKVARERGWEVRVFANPVRLRDRVRVSRWTATAAIGGAVAAGAGAAWVAWRQGHRNGTHQPTALAAGHALFSGGHGLSAAVASAQRAH